jgi:DNA primase
VARIKDSSVEEVKRRAEIVDVVSQYTSLRKRGARFVGRCPFHEEKTPSFSVNGAEGFYHCFGCQRGGDTIRFVREIENLDFVGAIEWLADRFRVELEYEESSPEQDAARRRRERQYAALREAATYFERVLWESAAGEPVRAYLASRNLGEAVAREFGLGLSPGRGLAAKAKEKGFTAEELRSVGLLNARGNDYFPQRLMFPLADARGNVIGFQARKLRDDDPLRGKYVNSPESELFHKSHVLYGLHLARPAIAKQERAVVVEGNTDVIALRQAGFEPVVASMGTALTEPQLRELGRLTRRVFLCFDSDAAGEDATLRGMELAVAQGFDVRVVALPKGQDPADAPEGFEERLASASSYLVHRVRLELARASDRQEAWLRARAVLERVEDSPERQEALRLVGDALDLPRETLTGIAPARGGGRRPPGEPPPRLLDAGTRLERDTLAAALAHDEVRAGLGELSPEHFELDLHRRFRALLVDGAAREDDLVALHAELDALADRERIDEGTGKELLLRLRERKLRRDLGDAGADPVRAKELQTRLARVREALADLA